MFFLVGVVLGGCLGYGYGVLAGYFGIPEAKSVGKSVKAWTAKHTTGSKSRNANSGKSPAARAPYEGGWGPARRTWSWKDPPRNPGYNTIKYTDYDSRDFVGCRWSNASSRDIFNNLTTDGDGTVTVRASIENNATRSKSAIHRPRMQIAFEPLKGAIGITLSGRAPVREVWDGCRIWSETRPKMSLVPGSGRAQVRSVSGKLHGPVNISDDVLFGKQDLPRQPGAPRGQIPGSTGTYGYIQFQVTFDYK